MEHLVGFDMPLDATGLPRPSADAVLVKMLRQQRNNLVVQMLEMELTLMLERERLAAANAELAVLRTEPAP
jgi:hypothetical protein